jgi:hypothetical protein
MVNKDAVASGPSAIVPIPTGDEIRKLSLPGRALCASMQQIVTATKRDSGIDVQYEKGSDIRNAFFSYSKLIDMKINALDLLDVPDMYLLDEKSKTIKMSSEKSAKK